MAEVKQIDVSTASDDILGSIHELMVVAEAEDLPDDEPMPLAARLADWRNPHNHRKVMWWVIADGDAAIAFSGAWMDREQNLQNGHGWVYVHPNHRSQGLGRAIASPMLDALEREGRSRFATHVKDGRPEEAIVERAGLKSAFQDKRSRLQLADLDWGLMHNWIDRASQRAGDYELTFLEHPMADDLVERFCDLYLIMNTAPLEDFEAEDEVMTPEMLRDIEIKQAARGRTMLTYVAVHRPSGRWVGYTMIAHQGLHPHLAWQWDTGVHPDHRNKGLGRWLKGQMIKKLHHDYPGVRTIDTDNAGSNDPMLNINIEMGFKPLLIINLWQGDLASLRESLRV